MPFLFCDEMDNVRLHIMGSTDEDEEYYEECLTINSGFGAKTSFLPAG